MSSIQENLETIKTFISEAEALFGAFEGNLHKTVELAERVETLEGEPCKLLFDDALSCLASNHLRAGIMEAWSGTVFYLRNLAHENGDMIRTKYNNFPKHAEDIQEKVLDGQLLEYLKNSDLITKQRHKNLLGLLNKRNQASHPSSDQITQAEAIGFVHDTIKQINGIKARQSD